MYRGESHNYVLFLLTCSWILTVLIVHVRAGDVHLIIEEPGERLPIRIPNYHMLKSSDFETCPNNTGILCSVDGICDPYQPQDVWYYPNDTQVVRYKRERACGGNSSVLVYSEEGLLKLNRRDIGSSYEGLYKCRINETEVVVGLYTDDEFKNNTGPEATEISLSAQILNFEFNLTFNITNGPPTYISCSGPQLFNISENSSNVHREVINNGTATRVTVIVEQKVAGQYFCNVSNNRVNISGNSCKECLPALPAKTSIWVNIAETPTNLSVSRLGTGLTHVLLSWNGSSDVYLIVYNASNSSVNLTSETNKVNLVLPEENTYTFSVIALGNLSEGVLPSNISTNLTITLTTPTVNVTSFEFELTHHNISLNWSEPSPLPSEGYGSAIECISQCGNVMHVKRSSSPELTIVFNGYNLTYNCSVAVIGFYGENATVLFHSSLPKVFPLSPRNLTASSVSMFSMNVSWSEGPCSASINGYNLTYSNATYSYTAGINGENQTSYSITGLSPYTNYTITVSAYNKWGAGPTSERITVTTNESIPGMVSNLTSKGTDVNEITVSWNEPSSPNGVIIGYDLRYKASSSSLYDNSYSYNNTTNAQNKIITGLNISCNYTVQVRALTVVGPGEWEATESSTRNTESIKEFQVTRLGPKTCGVEWALIPSKAIICYNVTYRSIGRGNDAGVKKFNASTNKSIITDLISNDVYEFQIVAIYLIGGVQIVTIPTNFTSCQINTTSTETSTPSSSTSSTVAPTSKPIYLSVPFLSGIGGAVLAVISMITCVIITTAIMKCKRNSKRGSYNFKANSIQDMYTISSNEKHLEIDFELSEQKDIHRSSQTIDKHDYLSEKNGEVEVHPSGQIPVQLFGDYVAKNHSNCDEGFKAQYSILTKGEDHHCSRVAVTPTNSHRNRFCNITVYDDNRVILRPLKGQPDHQSDYINASYIKGYTKAYRYIATQGPLPKTVVDFWRLIWQEKSPVIVMVTNLEEDMKTKCHQYWPDNGSETFGPFIVTLANQQIYIDYTVRKLKLELTDTSRKFHHVTQYHFTSWPDHGVPQYSNSMTNFHRHVKEHYDQRGPMTVHCSAGVGRTGTFITIDIALQQIEKEGIVDIPSIINELRHQRMKMVQTLDQFIFINDAVFESATLGDTQINVSDLRMRFNSMKDIDAQTGRNEFHKQSEVLKKLTPRPEDVPRLTGEGFPEKNRSTKYLPPEKYRVILENNEYIHASFLCGYKEKRSFIVAENPMQSTCRNFWKMIVDYKCHAIVMMGLTDEEGKNVCYQYWPLESESLTFGEFSIALKHDQKELDYNKRVLCVTDNTRNTCRTVVQYQIVSWLPGGTIDDPQTVTHIIEEVTKLQRSEGFTPVTIHCSDTVTRSGIFCASATVIEKCKAEKVADVFHVVKAQRLYKPGSVPEPEHLQFIFEIVLTFLDTFEKYSNFEFN